MRFYRFALDDWMLMALVASLIIGFGQLLDWMPGTAHAVLGSEAIQSVEISGSLG